MDIIKAGTVLIENGTLLPRSLALASEPYSRGWTTVSNVRSDFERDISQARWTLLGVEDHATDGACPDSERNLQRAHAAAAQVDPAVDDFLLARANRFKPQPLGQIQYAYPISVRPGILQNERAVVLRRNGRNA